MQRKINKAANFNRRKNIRLVNWNNATWKIDGSSRAYNTPTLGAELLTDGGFENWTTATNLTSWTEGVAGTSTVNQETSIVQAGTSSLRITVDASGSLARVFQTTTALLNRWYQSSVWARSSALGKRIRIELGSNVSSNLDPGTTWTKYFFSGRFATSLNLQIIRAGDTSCSLYADSVTLQEISLPTALATIAGSASNQTATAKIHTINTGTQIGIASLVDSSINPQNFIIAYHDGTNVKLEKCVAGVYTQLISTAVTFVSNAPIEIRRPSGNTFQLWYNGTQRGTDQTINDSGIINNTLYGMFSIYSGNLISEFTLGGVVIPFTF